MDDQLRVLLLEDSEEDAELILRELERGGLDVAPHRVDSPSDFQRALDDTQWDAILSDYSMPAFDGLRAHTMVRERELDVPFIIVSGTVGEDVAVQAMRRGVHDYLLKDNLARLPGAVTREIREAAIRRDAKLARAELELRERRYHHLFNSAAVPLWEVDMSRIGPWLTARDLTSGEALRAYLERYPDQRSAAAATTEILDVNDTTVGLIGADEKDELLGGLDRILTVVFDDAWQPILEGIADGDDALHLETTLGTMDGHTLHVLVSAQLPRGDEDMTNVVVTTYDMTDRWQLEAQMRAAQRMEAIGQLAGGVAHDFNNVLTVIHGYATFAREQLGDADPARQDIATIEDAARRASRLTSQLLAFSRRQLQLLEVIDLNDSIRDIEELLRRLIGEDLDFVARLGDDLAAVRADPRQIEQIVMNLAVNARDAMPEGGKLTIETSNVALDEVYAATKNAAVRPGDYVMLAVCDSGTGIDRETQLHIFEPFFTTKETGKGTGLGLSTVYGIVKQSRGYIWVYSEPGFGTTFKIYLPRVDDDVRRTPRRRVLPPVTGGTETILLVEDEELVRKVAIRILEGQRYRVLGATDGADALTVATSFDGPIDLLLTDIVMPELGGRRLVEQLTVHRPEMKIVYMSGYTDNAVIDHGVLDEAVSYIQKPFTAESLLRTIRAALDDE